MSDKVKQENKITITRALSEIKTLTDRISKAINTAIPCAIKQDLQPMMLQNNGVMAYGEASEENIKAVTAGIKSDYDSVMDLIKRRAKLRNAVMHANNVNKVTILGESMTIAEARLLADELAEANNLGKVMVDYTDKVKKIIGGHNAQLEADRQTRGQSYIDAKKAEAKEEERLLTTEEQEELLAKWEERFNKKQLLSIIDPIDAAKAGQEKLDKYAEYHAEIDYILSTINATTFITLD